MRVYYTLDKLADKRVRPALTVIYENQPTMHKRFFRTLWHVHHKPFLERQQNDHERECAAEETRVFSRYQYFFDKFANWQTLAEQCVQDDKVLQADPVAAEEFKVLLFANIKKIYNHEPTTGVRTLPRKPRQGKLF